jgi:hypothetical protein
VRPCSIGRWRRRGAQTSHSARLRNDGDELRMRIVGRAESSPACGRLHGCATSGAQRRAGWQMFVLLSALERKDGRRCALVAHEDGEAIGPCGLHGHGHVHVHVPMCMHVHVQPSRALRRHATLNRKWAVLR